MALFAIADLHLSGFKNKPMDIFGGNWTKHSEKIRENWIKTISPNDTILIPGDISWGLNIEEAQSDLRFIEELPGRKILTKGNHDYWWGSISRLNACYSGMRFIQNTVEDYNGIALCAARGWIIPEDERFTREDEKLYKRELIRAGLSLDEAVRRGYKDIIFAMHYPPAYTWEKESGFTELFKKYNVKKVVYGHLHGEKNFEAGIKGEHGGIEYILVSSDYLDFCPKKITD